MLVNWYSTQPIAHRGLHDGNRAVPENSLAACGAAVDRGIPIEIDVRLLADGTVAVFHDADLAPMTGKVGAIGQCRRGDLAALRLLGTQETIPTLEATLALVKGRVPLLIEIKNEGDVGALERATQAAIANYDGEIAIQSFNPYSLAYFRVNAPQIPRGQLAGDFRDAILFPWQKFILGNLLLNGVSQPNFIAYDLRALPHPAPSIARHLGGLPLLAWTIRDRADRDVARRHADNFIFETLTD